MSPRLARILAATGVLAAAAIGLAACTEVTVPSGSAGSGGSGAGGSGSGGTGGATTTTTTTGPLTCSVPVTMPAILEEQCNLLQQDCPAGSTCVPNATGTATLCRKEGGLKGTGKPCTLNSGLQECQAGLFCVGPPNGVGICTRPCCQADDQPCNGGDCNAEVNFPGVTIFMCSYSVQCTLFAENACENGQQCQLVYPAQGLAVCVFPSPDMVPEGGPCSHVNECTSAQVCLGGACRYNCKLGGGGDPGSGGCSVGKTCQDLYMGTAGDIGVCL
jgi:hypothetical protein